MSLRRRSWLVPSILAFGFAFLYVPILSMIVYSFNESRLASVWGGFSTKWYMALISNRQVVDALVLGRRPDERIFGAVSLPNLEKWFRQLRVAVSQMHWRCDKE